VRGGSRLVWISTTSGPATSAMTSATRIGRAVAQPERLRAQQQVDRLADRGGGRQAAGEAADAGLDHPELAARGLRDRAGNDIAAAHEVGGEGVARAQVDLARGALLDDHAALHDGDLVRHRQRLDLVVGDVDGGDAERGGEVADLHPHLLAQLGVEVRQRLVEQQELRLVHQRAGHRDPLLLAAGQERRRPVGQRLQLDHGERAHHPRAHVAGAAAAVAVHQREGDVVVDRHVRPDGVALEHHPEVAAVRRHVDRAGGAEHHLVGHRDLAAVGRLQPGDAVQGRGLAAAGRAEERVELAARDAERDAAHRGHPAAVRGEMLLQAADLKHADVSQTAG